MGMLSINIRILPIGCSIVTNGDCWGICGKSSLKEADILNILLSAKTDIMINSQNFEKNSNSYLLNKGIEMRVQLVDDVIRCLQFRICLSWYEEGIKEVYDILHIINSEYEIYDWLYNDVGRSIDDYQSFREAHIHFNLDKIELYKRSGYAKNVRLIEGELYEYGKKSIFGYKRNLKNYKRLK